MSLFAEIRRRKVFQVAAAYLVVAWVIVQVITAVADPLGFPAWAESLIIVLLGIGFPVTLVISWAFNLTSDGLVRDDGVGTSVPAGGRTVEQALLGLLLISVGWLLYQDMRPAEEPALIAVESTRMPNSIAILPLESMSPDPADAYFAQGIHEEIINKLFNLRNLNVIARTSVLQYGGVHRPITEVAEELNVEMIMEGSVSYAGNLVAVSAQLIDGSTGVHVWADRYYGELENVFEIQNDIAMNIANELEAEFSAAEQASLEKLPTEFPEAYGLYLRALQAGREESIALLDQAIEIDPNFALAYALQARQFAYNGRYIDDPDPDELAGWITLAEEAASTALSLDPTLGAAHVALGILQESSHEIERAERSFERAYQLSPTDPIVLEWNARFHRNRGNFDEAVNIGRRATELNPNDWWLRHLLGVTYRYAGNYAAAAAEARNAILIDPSAPNPRILLATANVALGNRQEALRQLQIAESLGAGASAFRLGQMAIVYSQAGSSDAAQRLFNEFQMRAEDETQPDTRWAMVYVAIGRYDEAFEILERAIENYSAADINMLIEVGSNGWGDSVLLNDPRFQRLRARIYPDGL